MKKITATLVMGLLLAFGVIGVSAQDTMKQDTMKKDTMKKDTMKKDTMSKKKMKKKSSRKMTKKSFAAQESAVNSCFIVCPANFHAAATAI